MRLLEGRKLAAELKSALRPRVAAVTRRLKRPPRLAFVVCAPQAEAETYFSQERRACAEDGVEAVELHVEPEGGSAALKRELERLSRDPKIDAVLVTWPLPNGFDPRSVLASLSPEKDVEGLTPSNQGLLYTVKKWEDIERLGAFLPCTALAILRLLRLSKVKVAGKHAVVLGRSNVVGRPTAHLLSCLDATVTLCHSRTRDLAALTRQADIIVLGVGKPGVLKGSMVKKGAVVVDAGTTWKGGKLRGDADALSVGKKASFLSPVPGGVGPVTTAELLNAVVVAAERKAFA